MKKLLAISALITTAVGANAQMAAGTYGPYEFVANYDHNGNYMEIKGFPEIKLTVMTTAFYGILQSDCMFSYDYFGTTQTSGWFSYQGISNGWYVYTLSGLGHQLLVSLDGDTIRTTNPYGGYTVYER